MGGITPRKRKGLKAVRSPRAGIYSPRREKRDQRERGPPSAPHPSLFTTLGYLLLPFRILAWPLKGFFSPVIAHVVNAVILIAIVALGVYALGTTLKPFAEVFPMITGGVMLPFRTIATPTCLLVNVGCGISLFSDGNDTARPFWKMWQSTAVDSVDVAGVSRSLSSEVRVARDIFDSLVSLGDGRMMEGLAHVR